MDLDEWFKQIRQRYASQMQCGKSCTACCCGLFDISLADALEVAQGFGELATPLQERVCSKGAELYREIRRAAPDAVEPLMFAEDDPRIDQIVDEAKSLPCPFLGGGGECLIYEHRPLSCRLEGVPMVDVCEGLFGDWCELNFTQGVPETRYRGLEQDYNRIDAIEEARSAAVAREMGLRDHRALTFIPSVIVEYDRFWKHIPLLAEEGWLRRAQRRRRRGGQFGDMFLPI